MGRILSNRQIVAAKIEAAEGTPETLAGADANVQIHGGNGYIREFPVATNVKAFKPVVSTYTTTCYPGDAIAFPILASDINTENLTLVLIAKPDGSTYDDQTDPPTFSWTPTVVGSYVLQVSVAEVNIHVSLDWLLEFSPSEPP